MKNHVVACAAASLLFAAATAVASERDEPVAVNTDHLQSKVAREVERHAAQGEKSLARYMEHTRPYHRLWFDDVMRPQPDAMLVARFDGEPRVFRKHAIEWR